MDELTRFENTYNSIDLKLEGNEIGILEKINLLWQQRQVLKDWEKHIFKMNALRT